MDFSLTETQQELASLVRQITEAHLTQQRRRTVESQPVHLDDELWAKLGTAGIISAGIPEAAGGRRARRHRTGQHPDRTRPGDRARLIPARRLRRGRSALAEFGTAAQQAPLARPDSGRFPDRDSTALTEELNDSPEYPTTRAERDGDAWVLTGVKAVVPYGPVRRR